LPSGEKAKETNQSAGGTKPGLGRPVEASWTCSFQFLTQARDRPSGENDRARKPVSYGGGGGVDQTGGGRARAQGRTCPAPPGAAAFLRSGARASRAVLRASACVSVRAAAFCPASTTRTLPASASSTSRSPSGEATARMLAPSLQPCARRTRLRPV